MLNIAIKKSCSARRPTPRGCSRLLVLLGIAVLPIAVTGCANHLPATEPATPAFTLSASPSTQTVAPGGSTTYSVNVGTVNGFNGSVDLSVSGLPTGATGSFAPSSVTGSGSSTLKVTTTNGTPIGSPALTITGTSGSSTHTATAILSVTATADFTLSATPSSQSVDQGSSTSYTVNVGAVNGFTGSVSLSASGLPSGATASFSPSSVSGSGPSALTVTMADSTPIGSSTLTITGTSGSLAHTATATLSVTAAADFTLSASPGSQSVDQGSSTSYTVNVGAVNGFTGSVSLSASGLPSGATASFSPSSVSGSGASTLTVSTAGSTPIGSPTLTIIGASGSLTHNSIVTLVVTSSIMAINPISIQFVGNGTAMASSEVAGVAALNNWNPEQGASGSSSILVDSTGSTTTAQVSWQADSTWLESIANQPGNYRMMLGYLDNGQQDTTTVTVSGLPSSSSGYTVYVYADGDTSASNTGAYQISGTGITTTSINLTYTSDFNGTFTQANNSVGNYVVFTIPNVSGFTLSAIPGTASSGYKRAPVNGIQIVPVGAVGSSNPDFTISASPGMRSVTAGGSTTYTVNVGAVNSFTGSVALSVTGLPSAATASFSPSTVSGGSGSSTLTVNTATSTPAGSPTLTIVGTSSSLDHTSTVMLAITAAVSVSISPTSVTVPISQSQQFTDTVQNTGNTAVNWQVNGVTGGNSTVGTISTAGLYTAPNGVPTPNTITVTAVSQADTTKSASASVTITGAGVSVLTSRYDNARTGQDLQEYVLNPSNVNQTQFGKLFSCSVDGYVYTEPLYVADLAIPGQGTHNVVFVGTEHDSMYAFDADSTGCSQIWHDSFINPSSGITTVPGSDVSTDDITPEIGITGTPVIDPQSGTLYVVAATKENGTYVQRLHALDITTGAERSGSPVAIQASVAGSGDGSSAGTVYFDPLWENQRGALLLVNGVVYIAFGSHGDNGPYHGWVLGYNASTLNQTAVFNSTPNGSGGGIWQCGDGPSADSSGNIYVIPNNGTFDLDTGGADYGGSFVKLNDSLTPVDYFTPYNQAYLNSNNWAPGTSAAMVIPDQTGTTYPHLALGVGKDGEAWLVNRDNMGHYNTGGNTSLQNLLISQQFNLHEVNVLSGAFWQNNIYFLGVNNVLQDYQLSNDQLSSTPVAQASTAFGFPGAIPTVSADGSSNGIVWVLDNSAFSYSGPAILHAYTATNVADELWNSSQAANARDQAGPAVKFTVPTVANGKVYVGGAYQFTAYGLLP